jgi:hypothetical protein
LLSGQLHTLVAVVGLTILKGFRRAYAMYIMGVMWFNKVVVEKVGVAGVVMCKA